MAWWPTRKKGKHQAGSDGKIRAGSAFDVAARDLRETIMRGREVDRLVLAIRREFRPLQ